MDSVCAGWSPAKFNVRQQNFLFICFSVIIEIFVNSYVIMDSMRNLQYLEIRNDYLIQVKYVFSKVRINVHYPI